MAVVNNSTMISIELPAALADSVQVATPIQSGAFGSVFAGTMDGEKAAIKVQTKHLKVVSNEIAVMQALEFHPNIVALKGAYVDDKMGVLVTELCDADLLDIVCAKNGLPWAQALRILRELADAIEFCHSQGIHHCDIKPDNVLLAGTQAKLADFGAATLPGHSKFGNDHLGSLPYMAPEMFRAVKGQEVDFAAGDMWAIGITFFTMLTARQPWAQASNADPAFVGYCKGKLRLPSAWPTAVDKILRGLLAVDPVDRWCASELLIQLAALSEAPRAVARTVFAASIETSPQSAADTKPFTCGSPMSVSSVISRESEQSDVESESSA